MKVYFSGHDKRGDDPRRWVPEARVMEAYCSRVERRGVTKDTFLDSGAHSLRGKQVDYRRHCDRYADFVKRSGVNLYANMDVIGDAESSLRNQQYLESLGLSPLPVVHFPDSPDPYLEYDYIGAGGLVQSSPGIPPRARVAYSKRRWLERLFNKFSGKVHGFGVGPADMIAYPWHSVDSATWLVAAGMGCVFMLSSEGLVKVKATSRFLENWLALLGLTFEEIQQREGRLRANILCLRKLENHQVQWSPSCTGFGLEE